MNNKVLALSLLYVISSYAASNEPVVTKPYKPSVASRYHTEIKAALTATFAVGAICAYANRQHLDKASCAALGGASLLYMHQMTKKQSLLDMLLTSPKAALDSANAVRDQCAKEEERTPASPEKTQTLLNKFTKKNPLFLLGECTEEGWGLHCLLSRRYEPKFRQQFESGVVTSLNNKLLSLNRPVQYVGFASGGMFQDHVILTKTLAAKPNAQLDVHLIDIKHAPYVRCRDLLANTRSVDPHIPTDPTPVMEAFKKDARENGVAQDMSDEELKVALMNTCECLEAPAQQSIKWLSKTFPEARLRLHLHDTADSYSQYIDTQGIQSPDVVATADIQDEMSSLKSAEPHYTQLCVRALQKNPHADNLWLTKSGRNRDKASLASIRLEETAGSDKQDIEVQGTSLPVYITSQKINTSFWRRLIGR